MALQFFQDIPSVQDDEIYIYIYIYIVLIERITRISIQ